MAAHPRSDQSRNVLWLVAEFQVIGESVERFNAFLSPCCLKEKRERHCHPTARAPSRASLRSLY